MSSHIKHRLWSQLRAPATPFASKSRPLRNHFDNTIPPSTTRRAFSHDRSRRQSQTAQGISVFRKCAPWGIFFFDIGHSTTAAPTTITSCMTTTEKSLYTTISAQNRPIINLSQLSWMRGIHSNSQRRQRDASRRNRSSTSTSQGGRKDHGDAKDVQQASPTGKNAEAATEDHSPTSHNYMHLPHLPKIPHRPTKDELLAAATGFWSRLKVRFKWFAIRSSRPWNIDDWSAFVSWFVLGNIAWIFIGTTTFFSLVILSINTVVAQGMSVP